MLNGAYPFRRFKVVYCKGYGAYQTMRAFFSATARAGEPQSTPAPHYLSLFKASEVFADLTPEWRGAADKQIQSWATLEGLEARAASSDPPRHVGTALLCNYRGGSESR
jgi:hypothetical protein